VLIELTAGEQVMLDALAKAFDRPFNAPLPPLDLGQE
jgi:hypothetical protein